MESPMIMLWLLLAVGCDVPTTVVEKFTREDTCNYVRDRLNEKTPDRHICVQSYILDESKLRNEE